MLRLGSPVLSKKFFITLFENYNYGEIKNAHKLSSEIVKSRGEKDLSTTFDLLKVLEGFVSKSKKNQFFSK